MRLKKPTIISSQLCCPKSPSSWDPDSPDCSASYQNVRCTQCAPPVADRWVQPGHTKAASASCSAAHEESFESTRLGTQYDIRNLFPWHACADGSRPASEVSESRTKRPRDSSDRPGEF